MQTHVECEVSYKEKDAKIKRTPQDDPFVDSICHV